MATAHDQRPEVPVTRVSEMPPMEVVTEGIPAAEHVGDTPTVRAAPKVQAPPMVQAAPTVRELRGRMLAWALAGVLGLLLVIGGILGATRLLAPGSSELHMGLSTQAWQEYRGGERAPFVAPVPGHMGLTAAAWQEYRAGERAFGAPGHMGLSTQAWQEYRSGERAA